MRMRENRHKKEAEQRKQEAFEERQDMINNSVSDFNSGTTNETTSFEDQVTDPTKDTGSKATAPVDVLEDTHKDTDFSQEDAIEEAKSTVSNGEKTRNELIQDNMNEKLADKGIKVNDVNSTGKIERGTTKGVTIDNKPIDYDHWNNKVQDNMNSKLADDGVKVDNVNTKAVDGKSVNPVKNVNPPKTETKRFKDDSGYVTRTIPNKPVGHITQGIGSQKSQSQSHDSRDNKDRPADLL